MFGWTPTQALPRSRWKGKTLPNIYDPIEYASAAGQLERFAGDHYERFRAAEQNRAERYAYLVQKEISNNGALDPGEREELEQYRIAEKLRGDTALERGRIEGRSGKEARDYVDRKRIPPGPIDPAWALADLDRRRLGPGPISGSRAQRELMRLRRKGYPQ
jgi:hypothetical protein